MNEVCQMVKNIERQKPSGGVTLITMFFLPHFPLVSGKISTGAKTSQDEIPINSIVGEALLVSKIPNSLIKSSKGKKNAYHWG